MQQHGEFNDDDERVVHMDADSQLVTLLNRGEIDIQIATAKKYPRSIKAFRDEVLSLATLNENSAEECSYALQRKDKNGKKTTIVGPTARFAEIVAYAFGHCRAAARIVDDRGAFITAQGAFMDVQKNTAIAYEVRRRITTRDGRRFSDDMIGVTGNAASSIALRNAILKGVPKALWSDLWEQSRRVALGDAKTHATRRDTTIKRFAQYGVDEAMVLAKMGRASVSDITPDDLLILIGFGTALKDGDTTVEQLFSDEDGGPADENKKVSSINDQIRGAKADGARKPQTDAGTDETAAETSSDQPASETAPAAQDDVVAIDFAEVAAKITAAWKAKSLDKLDEAVDLIRAVKESAQQDELQSLAKQARKELEK